MENLQNILSHGVAVATQISYKIFSNVILRALFIIDENHLELAIEQDVDLLPLFLIYAPQYVKATRDFIGRMGRGYESKITLPASLKFLDCHCKRRNRRYYQLIVKAPEVLGADGEPVYPPPGYDEKRVGWFWGNVQRLVRFMFHGEVPERSKRWGVEHLKWLQKQKEEGKSKLGDLLEAAQRDAKSSSPS